MSSQLFHPLLAPGEGLPGIELLHLEGQEVEEEMIKPFYEEEAGVIYCGDCREILPQLPKVDLVLTDPDYNGKDLGVHSKKYDIQKMALNEGEYAEFCRQWFEMAGSIYSECQRVYTSLKLKLKGVERWSLSFQKILRSRGFCPQRAQLRLLCSFYRFLKSRIWYQASPIPHYEKYDGEYSEFCHLLHSSYLGFFSRFSPSTYHQPRMTGIPPC